MKYIEIPDLHFSPFSGEIIKKNVEAVVKAASDNQADFVVFPGDITDRSLQASEKGGINLLRELISKITDECPAAAIYGTPSHEPPGSLEHLEDCGLKILRPGRVYGLYDEGITDIAFLKQEPQCILFGIPELNKKNIQTKLQLAAEEANAEAVTQLKKYIETFIAPQRLKYENLPAICLFHGNMTDTEQENSSDIIMRASDIVINSECFRSAYLDRISLGHIHKPWESNKINAGYAGSWGKSWGETGFLPAMNLIDTNNPGTVKRIPYGTPERRKITQPSQAKYESIAYWLCTAKKSDTLPDHVHPWSRITYEPEKNDTRRITREQAKKIKTLADMFKMFDKKISKRILEKVNIISSNIEKQISEKRDIKLLEIEVSGCVLLKNRKLKLSKDQLIPGLNGLRGDNGSGKSSVLSFCTPYPCVVGKDTRSGRSSSIKDFFDERESYIRKKILYNNEVHVHFISIEGAHTQNPKVECYFNINGETQLEKGTFDEMFTECEKLYGPYNDYLLTSFYVQPLQSKTGSSLMSATMTEIRDLVLSIAGIDREQEKRFALDKVSEIEKNLSELKSWLSGAEEFKADISALEKELNTYKEMLVSAQEDLSVLERAGKSKNMELEDAIEKKQKTDLEIEKKNRDQRELQRLKTFLHDAEATRTQLKTLLSNADEFKKQLKQDQENRKKNSDTQKLKLENETQKFEYEKKCSNLDSEIKNMISKNENLKSQLLTVDNPCPNCGYIDPESKTKIQNINKEIQSNQKTLDDLNTQRFNIDPPKLHGIEDPVEELTVSEYSELEKKIEVANQGHGKLETLDLQEKEAKEKIKDLVQRTYDIDTEIKTTVDRLKTEVEKLRDSYNEKNSEKKECETRLNYTQEKIEKAKEVEKKIRNTKAKIGINQEDREDWSYIATLLQSSKIPAMELDLVLDLIDETATEILEPLDQARFSFTTTTQTQGKKSAVDKFEIMVNDSLTGKQKSFLQHSVGEKAFLSDAYTKALIEQRNERSQILYEPVIMDESDGPIQPEKIPVYYEMQKKYWKNSNVFVVSHSPASHEYIENNLNVEDLLL